MSSRFESSSTDERSQKRNAYLKEYRNSHKAEAHAYYIANKDKKLLRDRKWREQHRESYNEYQREYQRKNREKLRAYHAEWSRKNHEHILVKSRQRRLKNIEKIRAQARKYVRTHPAEVRERLRKRRKLRTELSGNLKLMSEWMVSVRKQNKVFCYYCHKLMNGKTVHFDHVIPLVRGGAHSIENIAISCPECNMSKHAYMPSEWSKCSQMTMNI